jgi:hypothetical protein
MVEVGLFVLTFQLDGMQEKKVTAKGEKIKIY